MAIHAVLFDLDGVLVTTDKCHYEAWKQMADEQGIEFDRKINERLRGIGRMQSLDIILERADRHYSDTEKMALAMRKNDLYAEKIKVLGQDAILPGAIDTLNALREIGVKCAVGSSSRNTPLILHQLDLNKYFDAVADGNDITHSKPHPEVFLLAAKKLSMLAGECLVVEDANSGVEAALAGSMRVLGVGPAAENPLVTLRAKTLADIDLAGLIKNNQIL